MSRATYVMRNGRLVRKDRAAPLSGVHVISDDLGQALEHHGYDDGAGLVEKGNDRNFTPRRIGDNHSEVVRDVAQAVNMLKNGYRPQIRQFEE
jgi:hypothetical protein